jgi:lysozyme
VSLLTDLERDEGYRAAPYLDTAVPPKWTVAHGRNLEASPLTGPEWKALLDAKEIALSISPNGAARLLGNGITAAQTQCTQAFGWWPQLDEVRREVLVNLTFNMGMQRLVGFKNMLAAVQRGDYDIAADELLDSAYSKQVGARAQRLANQLRTGVRT